MPTKRKGRKMSNKSHLFDTDSARRCQRIAAENRRLRAESVAAERACAVPDIPSKPLPRLRSQVPPPPQYYQFCNNNDDDFDCDDMFSELPILDVIAGYFDDDNDIINNDGVSNDNGDISSMPLPTEQQQQQPQEGENNNNIDGKNIIIALPPTPLVYVTVPSPPSMITPTTSDGDLDEKVNGKQRKGRVAATATNASTTKAKPKPKKIVVLVKDKSITSTTAAVQHPINTTTITATITTTTINGNNNSTSSPVEMVNAFGCQNYSTQCNNGGLLLQSGQFQQQQHPHVIFNNHQQQQQQQQQQQLQSRVNDFLAFQQQQQHFNQGHFQLLAAQQPHMSPETNDIKPSTFYNHQYPYYPTGQVQQNIVPLVTNINSGQNPLGSFGRPTPPTQHQKQQQQQQQQQQANNNPITELNLEHHRGVINNYPQLHLHPQQQQQQPQSNVNMLKHSPPHAGQVLQHSSPQPSALLQNSHNPLAPKSFLPTPVGQSQQQQSITPPTQRSHNSLQSALCDDVEQLVKRPRTSLHQPSAPNSSSSSTTTLSILTTNRELQSTSTQQQQQFDAQDDVCLFNLTHQHNNNNGLTTMFINNNNNNNGGESSFYSLQQPQQLSINTTTPTAFNRQCVPSAPPSHNTLTSPGASLPLSTSHNNNNNNNNNNVGIIMTNSNLTPLPVVRTSPLNSQLPQFASMTKNNNNANNNNLQTVRVDGVYIDGRSTSNSSNASRDSMNNNTNSTPTQYQQLHQRQQPQQQQQQQQQSHLHSMVPYSTLTTPTPKIAQPPQAYRGIQPPLGINGHLANTGPVFTSNNPTLKSPSIVTHSSHQSLPQQQQQQQQPQMKSVTPPPHLRMNSVNPLMQSPLLPPPHLPPQVSIPHNFSGLSSSTSSATANPLNGHYFQQQHQQISAAQSAQNPFPQHKINSNANGMNSTHNHRSANVTHVNSLITSPQSSFNSQKSHLPQLQSHFSQQQQISFGNHQQQIQHQYQQGQQQHGHQQQQQQHQLNGLQPSPNVSFQTNHFAGSSTNTAQ